MGNLAQNTFYFFVGELVSFVLAIFIKDEKKRVWVIVIGTVISGVFAFGDKLSVPDFDGFVPFAKPSATNITPKSTPIVVASPADDELEIIANQPFIPTVEFWSIDLSSSRLDRIQNGVTIPEGMIYVICVFCRDGGDYLIYESSTDLDLGSAQWEFRTSLSRSKLYFTGKPGIWYKVVLDDPIPDGVWVTPGKILCCSEN